MSAAMILHQCTFCKHDYFALLADFFLSISAEFGLLRALQAAEMMKETKSGTASLNILLRVCAPLLRVLRSSRSTGMWASFEGRIIG